MVFQKGNILWKRVKYNPRNSGKKHSVETKRKIAKSRKKYVGKNHPMWKGGKIVIDGYIYIHSPNHPNRTKMGYVCEHRLVMERFLGKYLKNHEVAHHKNHNKQDNRIENLELLPSTGKHSIQYHVKKDIKTGKFLSF